MRKNFCALIIGVLTSATIYAQQHEPCASDHVLQQQIQANPSRLVELNQLEAHIQQYLQRPAHQRSGQIITIPVVFHVVYKTNQENISDAQVHSQIEVLNEDFRRLNSDASNTIQAFLGIAADTEIEFCLATTDPNGNPTTGITRTQTTRDQWCYNSSCGAWYDIMYSSSGGKDAWPRTQYMNLWVGNLEGSYLGWATYPGSTGPSSNDGVVCNYTTIGRPPHNPNTGGYNLGRTATHEVGHWLNLRHIWGHNTGCDDDLVGDTPFADGPNYSCNLTKISCNSLDMVQNYMDYTNNYCMNLFTEGQKQRMRAVLAPGGPRYSLLSSQGCTGQTQTCDVPSGMNTTSIGNTSATLNWSAATGAQSYTMQYRVTGTNSWTSVNTSNTSYTINSLQACTGYEWQVRSVCSGSNSNYSPSTTFNTTGCQTQSCDVPSGMNTTSIGNTSATLNWSAATGAQSYTVQYRVTGTNSWTSANTTNTSYTISSLQACTGYEWQVRSVCSGSISSYSPSTTFNTTGCQTQSCDVPSGMNTTSIGNTSATLNWSTATGAQSYTVRYRATGTNSWTSANTTSASYTISSLQVCTGYEWQVRSVCSGSNSNFSPSTTFNTTGCQTQSCDVPSGVNTTSIGNNSATLNWGSTSGAQSYYVWYRVTGSSSWIIANTLNTSHTIINLQACTSYEWMVQSICSGSNSNFSASLTFNTTGCQNQTCNVPSGLNTTSIGNNTATLSWGGTSGAMSCNVRYRATGASSWTSANTTSTSYIISNLQTCTEYEWQVQTVCSGGSSNFSASLTFNTTGCQTQSCDIPTGQSTSNIGNSSATLNWNAATGAQSYNVRYRVSGNSSWITLSTTASNYNLTNLQVCTGYEWQVQTVCSGSSSSFSSSTTFTTTGCETQSCDPPGNIVFSQSGNTITMTWNPVSSANSYEVGINKRNKWETTTTSGTSITIGGIKSGQSFDWQIRSICSSGYSAYVSGTYTAPGSSGGGGPGNGNGGGNNMEAPEMRLFPNPANTQATIHFGDIEDGILTIEATDMAGRRVFLQQGVPSSNTAIDISTIDWHQGMYLIRVMDATGILFTERLVIVR